MSKTGLISRVACVLFLLGGLAAAQEPDTQYTPGPKLDPAAVERGRKVFLTNCSFCHAADATGASGPDLLRSPLVLRDQNGNLIGEVVRGGRAGTAMPPFPTLAEDQIADIAVFLRSQVQQTANRMKYEIKGLMTGDVNAGAAYFAGAGRCKTCHSATGDLAGIARRYTPQQLLAQIAYPAPPKTPLQGDEEAAKKFRSRVTVTLARGRKVSGELVHLGEFDVSLRDAEGWEQTFLLENGDIKVAVSDPLASHKEQLAKYSDADLHNLLAYLETLP